MIPTPIGLIFNEGERVVSFDQMARYYAETLDLRATVMGVASMNDDAARAYAMGWLVEGYPTEVALRQ
jgi:hypothetical protein